VRLCGRRFAGAWWAILNGGVGEFDDTWRARLGAGHEALPAFEHAAAGGYSSPAQVHMMTMPLVPGAYRINGVDPVWVGGNLAGLALLP
jgi:hypothetical protein